MADRLTGIANVASEKVSSLNWLIRIPIYLLLWPSLLIIRIARIEFNLILRYAAIIFLFFLVQLPWLSGVTAMFSTSNVNRSEIGQSNKDEVVPTPSSPAEQNPVEAVVDVNYQNFETNCDSDYFSGSLEIVNSSNVSVSGRVDVPVKTYEKFMIPLSGVFLNLPADSSTVISLTGKTECKKGQIVGEPEIVFTFPSSRGLQEVNRLDAFKWSNVSATCDAPSGLVRLRATALNTTSLELTAGIQAYLANGPLSDGQKRAGSKGTSYFGTIDRLKPGESQVVDFGYGDSCIKGRKGFDGPYFTEFETIFTY